MGSQFGLRSRAAFSFAALRLPGLPLLVSVFIIAHGFRIIKHYFTRVYFIFKNVQFLCTSAVPASALPLIIGIDKPAAFRYNDHVSFVYQDRVLFESIQKGDILL